MSLKKLPPVLSIQLKRFEHTNQASKIDTHVRVPMELDMTPFTLDSIKQRTKEGERFPFDPIMYD